MAYLWTLWMLLLLAASPLLAQQYNKEAKQALTVYKLDRSNYDKLQEALQSTDLAILDKKLAEEYETWALRGEIYNALASSIITIRQTNNGDINMLPPNSYPAIKASEAYQKAYHLANKKYQLKESLQGLRNSQTNVNNMGIYHYEERNYQAALQAFEAVLAIHDILKKEETESVLDAQKDYHNQLYLCGLAAYNAGMNEKAKNHLLELYIEGTDETAVYEILYNIEAARDGEEAYKYLRAGRELYPRDASLLFAEINHFLRIGDNEKLLDLLKQALELEPNNISLYTTTGSVYEDLFAKAHQDGNQQEADNYFNKAREYYKQAMERDPQNTDAIYSLGALYFNKAAYETKELQKYADDYSEEGIEMYNQLIKDVKSLFDLALPYFKEVERMDPNDINTLIALKEIYARKDDNTMYNIFKERLEKVQQGGRNETSYFNQ